MVWSESFEGVWDYPKNSCRPSGNSDVCVHSSDLAFLHGGIVVSRRC